ncbi:MAG: ASKHA domain-containing protein [Coriobacteriia bacterium]|nr:ASKHA domain-containing protein [Coriobacteriia bacterium]
MSSLYVSFPALGRTIKAAQGDNLLEVLRGAHIPLQSDCGGIGNCGRCRVNVNGNKALACLTYLTEDIEVVLPTAVIADGPDYPAGVEGSGPQRRAATREEAVSNPQGSYAFAIDLGTTTLAGKLVDLSSGRELGSFAQLNEQQLYGADVISRINGAIDDASKLSHLITSQLDALIAGLLTERRIPGSQVARVVIAGNTAMSYLLLNLPCRSLGTAPFAPKFTLRASYPYEELFHTQTLLCDCVLLPFISAFVGGDLTSGLCLLGDEDDFILMDMGTNGEIVFKRGDRLLCTATAAGPAFEGSCIECGMGSIPGAISSVTYVDGGFCYQTIGAVPAIGICGSGLLDLMAVLLQQGFVDSTGFMTEKCKDGRVVLLQPDRQTGASPVFFTQKDVRQFQLAKSAIRSGIEVICREMGGELPRKVYLAGGFGQSLNPQSALATGLLPESFSGRVIPVGNSSLNGAVKLCMDESLRLEVPARIANAQEINLATHPLFSDLFMEHMAL